MIATEVAGTQTQVAGVSATAEAHAYATVRAISVATQREAGEATRMADATATAEAPLSMAGVPGDYELRYYESFETNTTIHIWDTVASGDSDYSRQTKLFEDGAYVWTARAKQGFITWEFPDGVTTSGDFYLATDARLADGEPASRYGLVFRRVDRNNFYIFYVNSKGYYWIYIHRGEVWVQLGAGHLSCLMGVLRPP
jgi:hypothetical protein